MNRLVGRRDALSAKIRITVLTMLPVLVLLVVLATAVGAVYVPFTKTIGIVLKNIGLTKGGDFSAGWESIIFLVRLPRVVVAALVGAALATSGTVMQGMFRNPMADPGIIGVSSGASLGAVIAIALGLASGSLYFLPLFASVGSLAAAFTIFMLASRQGKIPVMGLILSGVAVSMFLSSITMIVLMFINGDQVKQFLFWTTGSLNGKMWEDVRIIIVPIIACIVIILMFSRDLNVLLLGEEEAQSVGLNPSRARKLFLLLSSVTAATAVCVSGTISFVGLIVPHILRLIVGPDHRILLPASALGGAIFLVACDLAARTVLIPQEIGVGIVTSLLGAPYFLYLLMKARKEGGVF